MKAVKITSANVNSLSVQYHVEPADIEDLLPLGYILLAEFAGEWYEGVITQATFDEFYTVGQTLENDYFIAVKK